MLMTQLFMHASDTSPVVLEYIINPDLQVVWLQAMAIGMVGDHHRHNSILDFLTCYYILHCNEFLSVLNFMLVLSIF